MSMIDLIIVSDGTTRKHRSGKLINFSEITTRAIKTAKQDSGVNVIVVEANKSITYADANTLHYEFEFNYNRCLNYGAKHGTAPYIAFANNDLIFEKGWTGIIDTMRRNKAVSGSPICPKTAKEYGIRPYRGVISGTAVRRLFCGWLFIWERSFWALYPHDERRKFWTADNASAWQLRKRGAKHILDTHHIVHHEQSLTLDTMPKDVYDEITFGEVAYFNSDYKENLFKIKPKLRN